MNRMAPRSTAAAIVLAALALLYMTGCAKTPAPRTPVARVSTVPAERAVLQVERHARAVQAATSLTADAITAATATATTLLRATPPNLRPLVEELQTQIAHAQKQAGHASQEAAQLITANALTQAELAKVAQQAEAAVKSEARLADERDLARNEAAIFREERDSARARNAWLWLALVILAIVFGIFLTRK